VGEGKGGQREMKAKKEGSYLQLSHCEIHTTPLLYCSPFRLFFCSSMGPITTVYSPFAFFWVGMSGKSGLEMLPTFVRSSRLAKLPRTT